VTELVNSNEKNSFYLACTSNDQSHWQVGSFESENIHLKIELEKQQLVIELKHKELAMQAREIENLHEMSALLKRNSPESV
jgi:hypothetical protein